MIHWLLHPSQQPFLRHKEAISISHYITEHGLTDSNAGSRKKRFPLVLVFCSIALALVLAALVFLLLMPEKTTQTEPPAVPQTEPVPTEAPTAPTESEPRIAEGVTISGLSVAGMTKEEAAKYLREQISSPYTGKEVMIAVNEDTFPLSAEAAGIRWNVEKAVSTALRGTEQEIALELTMDSDRVLSELRAFLDPLGGAYIPSGYWVEGEAPDLELMTEPSQTLVINVGSAGYPVDLQDICDRILPAFQEEITTISVDIQGERKEPQELDLDKIFRQVSTLPVNPRVNPETLEVIPGKVGYGFDPEEAKAMLEAAKPGEALRLQLGYLEPAVEEEAWFQDTLGYCKTEYTDNENRNENIRLACSKLNGLILQPGETLSYNELLGKRTTEAGYKPAPAYVGTELVDDIGGGICQVSSTLYLSSLFAELHIVERKNHGYPASYIPLGLDATVNWGTTDLKLRNDYDLPVKILADASDGFVKVRVMGVERRSYYVKMEYRVDDHPSYAAAFLCRYDRETDEQIYRVLDHTSSYLEDVWCYPGYAENATDGP